MNDTVLIKKVRRDQVPVNEPAAVVFGLESPGVDMRWEAYRAETGTTNDEVVAQLNRDLLGQRQRADAFEARMHQAARERVEAFNKLHERNRELADLRVALKSVQLAIAEVRQSLGNVSQTLLQATSE